MSDINSNYAFNRFCLYYEHLIIVLCAGGIRLSVCVSAGWSTDRAMLAILAVGNRGKLRGLASSVKSLCIMSPFVDHGL